MNGSYEAAGAAQGPAQAPAPSTSQTFLAAVISHLEDIHDLVNQASNTLADGGFYSDQNQNQTIGGAVVEQPDTPRAQIIALLLKLKGTANTLMQQAHKIA